MMNISEHFIYRQKIVTSSGIFSICKKHFERSPCLIFGESSVSFEMQLKVDKMYWKIHKVNWRSWIWTYSARAYGIWWKLFLYSFLWQSLYLIEIANSGSFLRKQWYYLNSLTLLTRIYSYDWHFKLICLTDKCSK